MKTSQAQIVTPSFHPFSIRHPFLPFHRSFLSPPLRRVPRSHSDIPSGTIFFFGSRELPNCVVDKLSPLNFRNNSHPTVAGALSFPLV